MKRNTDPYVTTARRALRNNSKRLRRVLFIGTQFSNLYTAVDTPVGAA
jgi:hypothetical protein